MSVVAAAPAASGAIQGLCLTLNTSGSPRTHSAKCRHRCGSKYTVISLPWYAFPGHCPADGDPGPVPTWDWGPGGPPAPAAPDAGQGPAQQATLPAPGEPVSFGAHIKPLFRDRDRQSMSFAFDLSSADDVRTHAAGILQRLQDGTMPCDGAWPAEQIAVFERWTVTGMEP